MGGMFAYIAGSPFVFMQLFQVPSERYGLFFGLNAFGIMLMGQANARLARRVAPERMLGVVLAFLAVAGLLLLGAAASGLGGFTAIIALLFCYVACMGAVMPLATMLAMAPQGRVAGSASALVGTLQFGTGSRVTRRPVRTEAATIPRPLRANTTLNACGERP